MNRCQDGEDLQRRLRHVLLPFGDDEALLLLRRRPVLLAALQPLQRLGEYLVAIAAQRLDVDPLADRADRPVAAVAGRVLQEVDVVGEKARQVRRG